MDYYCSTQDLETHLSTPTLTQLTSDEGNEIDSAIAEEAIMYASTLINGYLRGRYTIPLSIHFPLIRILAIDIAVYRLYSRRMRCDVPEIIAKQYNDAVKMLQDVQKGSITLDETDTLQAGNYRSNKKELDRLFNKTVLREY